MRRSRFVVSAVAVFTVSLAVPASGTGVGAAAARATPRWKANGPLGGQVLDLASEVGQVDVVYAALGQGGVFRSVNGGRSWAYAGLGGDDIVDVAVSSSGVVFAASETPARIFRTVKNRWVGANPGSDEFLAVAPSPSNPNIVYLAGDNGVTFRSIDGGKTWHKRGTTASSALVIAVDPTTPGKAYVGGEDDSYVTTNGGATWKPMHVPGITANDVAITPSTPRRIYVATDDGLFESVDGGGTWKHLATKRPITFVSAVAFSPSRPKVMYAGTDTVWRSTDGGATWTLYPPVGAHRIDALDMLSTQIVVAGDDVGGIFRSDGGVVSWKHPNTGLVATQLGPMAAGPGSRLFAATGGGMFKSTDGGATWSLDPKGPVDAGSIAFDPGDAQRAYAGTFFEGVERTVDGGAHWHVVDGNHGYALGLAVEPQHMQNIDAGAGNEIRRSVNGGDTWNPTGSIGSQVHGIAFSNEANPVTLAATSDGVFQSTDDGGIWHLRKAGAMSSVAFNPQHPLIAYAGGFGPKVVKSVDGGLTWHLSQTGINAPVTSLVIDPVHPSTVYVGTQGGGVFRSTDAGGHWAKFDAGLFNHTVVSMAIDPATGRTVYAGTTGNGVFVIHLP